MNWYWSLINACFGFIISCLITLYLIPPLIAVAHKLNIIDAPDGRLKKHKAPTAYLGGLAIYVGFIAALALTFPFENNFFLMLVGCTLLLFVGLIDDLIVMKPYQKLFGHMVAAFCFLKGGFYLKETFLFSSNSLLAVPFWGFISFGWILSVINAFNLVDVMDGLATTIAVCATASFVVMAFILGQESIALLLCCFLGALVAFWWYNKPLARMYLGDAGSLFIGGFLAIAPFMLHWGTFRTSGYFAPLVILLIPLLEVMTLIIIRTAHKIPFYQGSPHHFCHYLRKKGWSVRNILIFVGGCSVLLFLIAFFFVLAKISVIQLFLALFCFMVAWCAVVLL